MVKGHVSAVKGRGLGVRETDQYSRPHIDYTEKKRKKNSSYLEEKKKRV